MINYGYASIIDKIYRNINFPREFLGELDSSFIQYFMKLEDWEALTLSKRMESRKGMLVHFKKCKEAYPEKIIPYTELVIRFGDLIIDFLEKTKALFLDETDFVKMSKKEVNLFRLHAFLYCELCSINKERDLKNITHTLSEILISPVFKELINTKYYMKFNLKEIEITNKKVRELHEQNPFKEP